MRRFTSAVAVAFLLAFASVASGDEGGACLGPDSGRVLEGLAAAHALDGDVPRGYVLQRLDVEKDRVVLGYVDTLGIEVAVVLRANGGSASLEPKLEYEISDEGRRASADDRVVFLRAAAHVDRALVARGVVRYCVGPEDPRTGGVAVRAPRLVGVGLGAAQAAIVIAALVFGLRRGKRAE